MAVIGILLLFSMIFLLISSGPSSNLKPVVFIHDNPV